MSVRITLATAGRVLTQLRHDHRTVALLLFVPSLLMVLLRFVFDDSPLVFDRIGLPLLGVFPFITMFLVTSVTMLRERTTGTLERLLSTPMAKLDLLLRVRAGVRPHRRAAGRHRLRHGLLAARPRHRRAGVARRAASP